ncbi:MAG: HAD-IA family hydrolase [Piscinibacter sp.]|nr:HAD-IA family hydrolase [Piscinibacter sp.]
MKLRQFDLVVFDWDGTLFDSTALITRCIQESCADLGLPIPSDRDASYVIGLGLRDALTHAAPTLAPERYGDLALRYRTHYLARQHDLMLFDGALELLDELKQRRHLLAVATGKSRAGLDDALAAARLRGMFDATRTADETASKPHPRMLLELMDELDADPARTLMIGDTTHDLQLAANAGAESLAVAYGAHEPEALHGLAPRHVVHSVAELRDWLATHG